MEHPLAIADAHCYPLLIGTRMHLESTMVPLLWRSPLLRGRPTYCSGGEGSKSNPLKVPPIPPAHKTCGPSRGCEKQLVPQCFVELSFMDLSSLFCTKGSPSRKHDLSNTHCNESIIEMAAHRTAPCAGGRRKLQLKIAQLQLLLGGVNCGWAFQRACQSLQLKLWSTDHLLHWLLRPTAFVLSGDAL